MAGLLDITEKIIADATAEAERIRQKAEEAASKILAENEEALLEIKSASEERIAQIRLLETEKADLTLKSKQRERLLETKNQTAAEIIAEAKDKLLQLSDAEYFELLTEIYKNNAEDKEGELLLSAKDKKRMDSGFIEKLSDIKGSLTLSEEDAPGEGFVVRYGKVELNCTFDSIFREKHNCFFDIITKHCKE